jgi:hypothetical protein
LTKKRQRKRAKHVIPGGEGTANRCLALLSTIMSFAAREDVIDRNPVFGIERSPGNMRERFLSREELTRLGEVIARAEREGAHPCGLAIIRLFTTQPRGPRCAISAPMQTSLCSGSAGNLWPRYCSASASDMSCPSMRETAARSGTVSDMDPPAQPTDFIFPGLRQGGPA